MSNRQMSVAKISMKPFGLMFGANTVPSVPLIMLQGDVRPFVAFNQTFNVFRRFHFVTNPNFSIPSTPVYISNNPSCVLFFYRSQSLL